jgi:hypothetical protein
MQLFVLTRQQEGVYIRNMLGENIGRRSKTTEVRPSKEDIENLYNGYKDLLDKYGGDGDKIRGVGAVLSFDLKKVKITTEVAVEGKNIPLVVSQLRTKASKGRVIVNMDTRTDCGELVYLELSKKRTSWMYPERSLLDDALGKVLGRKFPTKKEIDIYSDALNAAKKQLTESSQNNSNQI